MDEEGDEGRGKFAKDEGSAAIGQRSYEPADQALQELPRVVFRQCRALFGVSTPEGFS